MLISQSKRFIFVANMKSASTSIEDLLSKYSEVRFLATSLGKHMTISQVEDMLTAVPAIHIAPGYYRFGVMREPLDYVLSIYNSHTKEGFRGKPHYTGDMTFDQFVEQKMLQDTIWQLRPQRRFFGDPDGPPRVHYIIDYARFESGITHVFNKLEIENQLRRLNCSPLACRAEDVSSWARDAVKEHFNADYQYYREYADRELEPDL